MPRLSLSSREEAWLDAGGLAEARDKKQEIKNKQQKQGTAALAKPILRRWSAFSDGPGSSEGLLFIRRFCCLFFVPCSLRALSFR
jgi:hypothetical protein